MKHNIPMIRAEALDLLAELVSKAHFDKFINDKVSFGDWLYDERDNVPDHIGICSGCTRLVFWDKNICDYVFKINIYSNDIDYGRQEEYIYGKAEENHVEECFAWTMKIIDNGVRSIYAMEFCETDSHQLSSEAWEHEARNLCVNEGWDFDNLTDEQREQIDDWMDNSDYACTEGMLDLASDILEWNIYRSLVDFINTYSLNDLHCGNWGYRNSNHMLVITDYAGFECNLMSKVA